MNLCDRFRPAARIRGSVLRHGTSDAAARGPQWLFAILLTCMLSGCAHRLPHYPRVDPPTALSIMNRRAQFMHSISAECRLTMSRPDGSTVELDAVLVARPPDYSRIRAWKMSRAVMDVTLTPNGLFVVSPQDSPDGNDPLAALTADRWKQAMLLLLQRIEPADWASVSPVQDQSFTIRKPIAPDGDVVCEIHRPTLTLRECHVLDADGKPALNVQLDHYATLDTAVLPRIVNLDSPHGQIRIRIDSIDLDADLPETAFVPPRRAVHRP